MFLGYFKLQADEKCCEGEATIVANNFLHLCILITRALFPFLVGCTVQLTLFSCILPEDSLTYLCFSLKSSLRF